MTCERCGAEGSGEGWTVDNWDHAYCPDCEPCSTCEGAGIVERARRNTSVHSCVSPDEYYYEAPCPECRGRDDE